MTKTISLITTILMLLSFSQVSNANREKFGKVSADLFESEVCPIDSNAHAYYLFDRGSTYFQYQDNFKTQFERHLRLRILDQSALDQGTFEISLYSQNGLEEKISAIKAITHNLENGKVIQTKLSKKDILRDHVSKNRILVKFAMPNVKAGSIVEVSYKISSDFLFNLQDWYFQKTIPVLKSEYRVEIPEYYVYKQFQKGYLNISTQRSWGTGSIPIGMNVLTYQTENYDYVVENSPAFPVGEHLTTIENYISKVDFELQTYNIPGVVSKSYNYSWDDINRQFLEDEDFGERLKNTGFLKECLDSISKSAVTDYDKMQAALKEVVKCTKWNEKNSCFTSQTLKKTFESGLGNSTDLNLVLLALLRELKLEAFPVALSTRSHGMIHIASPSISKFNYMIVLCQIGDEEYFLDATNKFAEVNVLPGKCINYQGRLIDQSKSRWVDLVGVQKYRIKTSYILDIMPDGTLNGQSVDNYGGNASYLFRNRVDQYESIDEYIEKVEEKNEGLNVDNYVIENKDIIGEDVRAKYDIQYKNHVELMGDLVFFTPLLFEAYQSNPLKLETREYPVEYTYPEEENVTVIYKIPEGYTVESIPESIKLSAFDEACMFTYRVQQTGSNIMVHNQIMIEKTLFAYNQYQDLKSFYEAVVKKQAEKIVLKKI